MKGCLQVYTGNGKGKTTAALGLLLRARGAGLRVYLGLFLKDGRSSEVALLRERFPEVTIEAFGTGRFVRGKPAHADADAARHGLEKLRHAAQSGHYDLVIGDEANVAARLGLFTPTELLAVAEARAADVELVLTGRRAHPLLLARADLVTEMRCRKHYFNKGVPARRGIEF